MPLKARKVAKQAKGRAAVSKEQEPEVKMPPNTTQRSPSTVKTVLILAMLRFLQWRRW